MRKLSVIATPIGNLEDITLRALRVLAEADVVVCEDTRVTKKLLSHFTISAQTASFHANSGPKGFQKVIDLLQEGKHVALVCDAGTPGISDPGAELISRIRDQFGDTIIIEAIPGPSALSAALSIAGLRVSSFTFYGFLPLKKGRETLLKHIASDTRASVFYESTHRIVKMLQALVPLTQAGRRIGLFRELTKLHEESIVGTPADVLEILTKDPNKQRGEFVIVLEACQKS